MVHQRIRTLSAVAILFALSPCVPAQSISVDPLSWDFGDVELRSSQSIDFTLTSIGPTPLTITNTVLIGPPSSPFSLTVGIPGTTILLPGRDFVAQVSFSPITLGLFEADFNVLSDASSANDNLLLALRGTGVRASAAIPEPPLLLLLVSALVALAVVRARPASWPRTEPLR